MAKRTRKGQFGDTANPGSPAPFSRPAACIQTPSIGKRHHVAPKNPYQVCITPTQWQTLFGTKRRGTDTPLGCGVFACAWNGPKRGTVVKITNDRTDVQALIKANAAKIKGVPKLHKAFRLQSPTSSDRPVYAMVVERLRTAGVVGKENVYCVVEALDEGTTSPKAIAQQCCRSNTGTYVSESTQACHRMAHDLPPTIAALEALGIPATIDLHEDNIGTDSKGRWKILDLGLSGLDPNMADPPDLAGARHARRFR